MTNPTTGYIIINPITGLYQDLSAIFQGGSSGITTGFKISDGQDLGSIFQSAPQQANPTPNPTDPWVPKPLDPKIPLDPEAPLHEKGLIG